MLTVLIILTAVILVDQGLKYWIVSHVALGQTILKNPIIDLTYLRNYGAAWSILDGKKWILLIIAIIAILFMIVILVKNQHHLTLTIGLSLALGGAIGNMIDRLRLGYVIDMFQLEFIHFPIFNVADIALCIGILIVMIVIFKEDSKGD